MDVDYTDGHLTIYHYHPSAGAAGLFIALFGIGTLVHGTEMFVYRAWSFWPFIVGCIMETFGYYGRLWSSSEPDNFKAYVLYALLVVPAPIFLSASLYTSLPRISRALADQVPLARSEKKRKSCCCSCCCACTSVTSPLFILADVILFIVQMAGLGMQATTSESTRATGRSITLVGLILQMIVFCVFLGLTWRLYVQTSNSLTTVVGWKRYVWALLGAGIAVLVRNIVRVAEYAQGPRGFVPTHEAFVYVFDAALMVCVVCLMAWWHPGRFVRRRLREKRALVDRKGTQPLVMQTAEGSPA